ncbi:MAG: TadE family type IV pilus minor pilin [Leifsonia sp.]
MRRQPHAVPGERGSAVAEFAVALPAVLLVLGMVLGGIQLGATQVRAQDAAADAARSLGRGEADSAVGAELARQLPGARWSSTRSGALVCAHLEASAAGAAALLGLTVSATSCAQAEQ